MTCCAASSPATPVLRLLVPLALLLVACGESGDADHQGSASDLGVGDTGAPSDAGDLPPTDLGAAVDLSDLEPGDAGSARDAGIPEDLALDSGPPLPADQAALLATPLTETWPIQGLQGEVHVLRTEAGVPHIYARGRADLGRALGFTLARDRYFLLEAQRRLALGTLSELLGADALEMDAEARMTGMTHLADRLAAHMDDDMARYADALAAGINAYIEQVAAGALPLPKELQLASALLGTADPRALMQPFDRRDIAALAAVVFYETNYETGDVGRTAAAARVAGLFEGAEHAELRRAGFLADVWDDVRPLFAVASTGGFGLEGAGGRQKSARGPAPHTPKGPALPGRLPERLLERSVARLERVQARLRRDFPAGFGSNAWAVSAAASADGKALLAGDGHLGLSVPSAMYQVALDTRVFGGGDTHQIGLLLAGFPILGAGTNGDVAFSMVNPVVDTTDWYREELQLDAAGLPAASRFGEEWRPLLAHDEEFVVADVPLLDSVGRTERWTRWTTFDGRFLLEIEGRDADRDEALAEGEALVNLAGDLVVPGDLDGDGVVSAISFDYTAFDATQAMGIWDRFGHARDVEELRQLTRGLVGVGLFLAAADSGGDILYSSYQAIPCRSQLPRDEDGHWAAGADPTLLLDGTTYGGFAIPTGAGGLVDEAPGALDPAACAVPFDDMPQALSPERGFVVTANSDPGGLLLDGSLSNDQWYLGGLWYSVRTDTIRRELEAAIAAGEADLDAMARIQGNTASRLGEVFAPHLVAALERAAEAAEAEGEFEAHQQRLRDLYASERDALDEVAERLQAWAERGYRTPSAVATFYHQPAPGDEHDAVATMIFNAWLGRFLDAVFADEGIGGAWRFSSSLMKTALLRRLLEGRGPDDPLGQASFFEETGESIFFDVVGTEAVERSEELLVGSLVDALRFLRSEPEGPDRGGFGTADMNAWLWGLRHQARFRSLLEEFLGDDPTFSALTAAFGIDTGTLPLTEGLSDDDPRAELRWFPRPGDQWAVDAANPGFGGSDYTYGSGAMMRMVIELGPDGMRGRNVIPGGQSADPDSPHFADQAALWLGNETLPMRFEPADVAAGATHRELLTPVE